MNFKSSCLIILFFAGFAIVFISLSNKPIGLSLKINQRVLITNVSTCEITGTVITEVNIKNFLGYIEEIMYKTYVKTNVNNIENVKKEEMDKALQFKREAEECNFIKTYKLALKNIK